MFGEPLTQPMKGLSNHASGSLGLHLDSREIPCGVPRPDKKLRQTGPNNLAEHGTFHIVDFVRYAQVSQRQSLCDNRTGE